MRRSAYQGYVVETFPGNLNQWQQKFQQLLQEKYFDAEDLLVWEVQVIPEMNERYLSQIQQQIQKNRETLGDRAIAGGAVSRIVGKLQPRRSRLGNALVGGCQSFWV
jgi:hypothetical protein